MDLRGKLERLAGARPRPVSIEATAATGAAELASVLPGQARRTPSGEHYLVSCEHPLELRIESNRSPKATPLAILAGQERVAQIPPPRWLFLDTETTGLAGGTGTYAFLVGVAQWANGSFRIDQYFMRGYSEERSLLEAVGARLAAAELLITFNGKIFDVPLLETRFRLARMRPPLEHLAHLDLLYPARQLWRTRLGSVRLLELERHVLRQERDGDIPGEMIPQIYFDYLRRRDPLLLVDIFRHNSYDLRALAALLERLVDAVASPEEFSPAEPLDLFGLSRLLESRRVHERSRQLYERCLRLGLPSALEPAALRRLAALSKRAHDHRRAAALFERWRERDAAAVQPEIELAIFHEHRTQDYAAALAAAHRALEKLNRAAALAAIDRNSLRRHRQRLVHRMARLERKQARRLEAIPGIN